MSKNTLIVVLVVLALVAGGYYLMTSAPKTAPNPAPTVDNAAMMKTATIALNPDEKNVDVAQSGTMTLEETATGLTVVMKTNGYKSDVVQPAHIHVGMCPDVGKAVYPLESIVGGTSTTILAGVTLTDLKGQFPLAVNVHKSAEEVSTYTSCGNLDF